MISWKWTLGFLLICTALMAEPYEEEQFVTADTYDITAGARRLAYDPNLNRLYVLGTWPENIATISVLGDR